MDKNEQKKEHSNKCASHESISIPSSAEARRQCDCDGYHTFTELYEHRTTLFITLCEFFQEFRTPVIFLSITGQRNNVWRSKKNGDGSEWEGWFILGIGKDKGKQITYHLPIDRWEETDFAETLDQAPEWDGHTSDDVLERLKKYKYMTPEEMDKFFEEQVEPYVQKRLKSQQERLMGEIEKKIDTMYKCEGITGDYILSLKEALEIIKKTYGQNTL